MNLAIHETADFVNIGFDDIRPAILGVIQPFRVNQHRLAALPRQQMKRSAKRGVTTPFA